VSRLRAVERAEEAAGEESRFMGSSGLPEREQMWNRAEEDEEEAVVLLEETITGKSKEKK
jgi:hypothetical protein